MIMSKIFQLNAVSQRCRIFMQDSTTFMGKTGLAWNTVGLTFYYSLGPSDTAHAIALVTNTVGGAYASGGFVEVDATHEPGWYQLDIPDACFVSGSGNGLQIIWKGTGVFDGGIDADLVNYDPFNIDKSGFALSSVAIQAIWNAAIASMNVAGSVGKLLGDNVAPIKADTAGIKVVTDGITVVSGGVELHAHGMDKVIGYHSAGDA